MKEASFVYQINPSLSMSGDEEKHFAVISMEGKIKILKCIPSVLEKVLNLFDGKRSVDEITERLTPEYNTEEISCFLQSLIEAEVVIQSNNHEKETGAQGDFQITVIGRGQIADAVCKKLDDEAEISEYKRIESDFGITADMRYEESVNRLEKRLSLLTQGLVVACPDECTFGWLLALNDLCLKHNTPFLLCYYNGRDIISGPAVIPDKTPCFGCLLEHRRRFMSKKGQLELPFDHLLSLKEARPIHQTQFMPSMIRWAADHVTAEVAKFQQRSSTPSLINKQIRIPSHTTTRFQEVHFEPISTCLSCFGMNRKRLKIGRPSNAPDRKLTLQKSPVIYRQGGRRSVTAEQAEQMVHQALERTGLEIKITDYSKGALDNILYRFTAAIEGRYNPDLPFLLPEDMTQLGKGVTEKQAYLSAAFELFERVSSRYYGDVEMIRAPYKEVEDMALNLEQYIGQRFYNGVMERFDRNAPVDWVWGHSLVHDCPRLVPASMTFLTNAHFMGHFSDLSSGGLAAGTTIEDAILQGLLEIVEHDAWITWQANAVTLPEILPDTIRIPGLAPILENIKERGLRVVIRNYITDFSIPVFRTWIVNDHDYRYYATNGLGANLDPAIALERSISEAYQPMEITYEEDQLVYQRPSNRNLAFSYYSLFNLYHFNQLEIQGNGNGIDFSSFSNLATDSVAGDIQKIISQIRKCCPDADVVAVNLTKEAFNIPVVRMIAGGGIQHMAKPALAATPRLFEMPGKFGYRSGKLSYKELFNGPFPH